MEQIFIYLFYLFICSFTYLQTLSKDLEHSKYITSIQQDTVSILMRNNWGLELFYQSQSSKIWCKHSLDWSGSIQQEVKGRVTRAGVIRSNQGFVSGQNIS